MSLSSFDNKCVRIVDQSGDTYDGVCRWRPVDLRFECFGMRQESLQIDERVFYLTNIRTVQELTGPPELWKNLPQHCMHLAPEPFALVKNGRKTVELRLWDEKRRRLRPGDVIRFECADGSGKVLRVRVTELLCFATFTELYAAVPLAELGCGEDQLASASPEDMDAYYSPEQQARWGVTGIRFTLL